MGAQIAAHLANAGWRATLLDIVPTGAGDDRKSRNAIVTQGLERAQRAKPPAFFVPQYKDRIVLGNMTDDLSCLQKADWIVEAVVEKEEIKKQVHAVIDSHAGPNAVVTTNTSALSIGGMSTACSPSYRSRFFGTHFFNPPRYMSLLELIPTPDSDPAELSRFGDFAEVVMGKSVVIARDTPGFIANRLGVCAMQVVLHATLRHGLSVEQVDELTGPLIGHPKSASFRLSDICGLDIASDVTANLKERLPEDRWTGIFVNPPPVVQLLASGRIGEKAGAGFYRREKDRSISALDWETLEYRSRKPVVFPSIEVL
jgi:3-hydroxyacyl-CoA dehydrogenase